MNKLILAASAAALCSGGAIAQEGISLEGGYQQYFIDGGEGFDDVSVGALVVRGGTQFTPMFGAEAELAIGVVEDEQTFSIFGESVNVDTKVNYAVSAFGTAHAPLEGPFGLHARAGVTQLELEAEASAGSISDSADESDAAFAYGFGGTYDLSPNMALRADFTRAEFDEAFNQGSLTFVYRLGGN